MSMTHTDVAVKLLTDAAAFFRNLGTQNQEITGQMNENADIFLKMADVLAQDPTGIIEQEPNNQLAGRLLSDAARFFREIADHNAPIKDQMMQNANVYENVSVLVAQDPMGYMAEG